MRLTINGKEIEAAAGETVLRTARRAGIDIPAPVLPRLGSEPGGLLPPLRGGGGGRLAPAHQLHA